MSKIYRYKINNTELLFDDVIYVSPKGNDMLGNGTENNPYITIKKAINMVNKNNTAIILKEGIYNERVKKYYSNDVAGDNCLFTATNYSITFIGQGNYSTINTEFDSQYSAVAKLDKINFAMYNLKINITVKYEGDEKSNYVLTNNNAYNTKLDIYNCSFNFIASPYKTGIYYGNLNGVINVFNCIFIMSNDTESFSGMGVGKQPLVMTNCIIKELANWQAYGGKSTTPYITMNNCIKNNDKYWNTNGTMIDNGENKLFYVIFNDKLYPTNTLIWKHTGKFEIKNSDNTISNIGLYGGLYSWEYVDLINPEVTIESYSKILDKNKEYKFNFNIKESYADDITRIDNLGIESFNDNLSITYLYNFDKTTWKDMNSFEIL